MKIAPSILAADFARLGEEIQDVEAGGADYIHVDVMDGHFVPNITMGPQVVSAIRPLTNLKLDVHLMVEEPDRYITDFVKAGADLVSVHLEACPHLHRSVHLIKEQGARAGVVLNPATPIAGLQHVLDDLDLVLLMTVNPGFGGQAFIENVLPKIRMLSDQIKKRRLPVEIEVDGGINPETAKLCHDAGTDVFVAGSAIFKEKNRKAAIEAIRSV
ncbi:MAG TPA: ribulose-phosphate 3-epimerase [Bacillales bacterium]|nr:ribulose-phosphate 3-epimerase [Bacillales bacterium]